MERRRVGAPNDRGCADKICKRIHPDGEVTSWSGAESAHPIIGDVRIKYVSVYPDGNVTSWSGAESAAGSAGFTSFRRIVAPRLMPAPKTRRFYRQDLNVYTPILKFVKIFDISKLFVSALQFCLVSRFFSLCTDGRNSR